MKNVSNLPPLKSEDQVQYCVRPPPPLFLARLLYESYRSLICGLTFETSVVSLHVSWSRPPASPIVATTLHHETKEVRRNYKRLEKNLLPDTQKPAKYCTSQKLDTLSALVFINSLKIHDLWAFLKVL